MGKLKQQTIGERLRILREHYKSRGLTAKILSEMAGISSMQLNNIENDKVKHVSYDFIKCVADGLGSTIDWIENGNGEMLPNGEIEINTSQSFNNLSDSQNPYKDALVSELKGQVEYLKEMLKLAITGKNPNFRKALNLTDFSKTKAFKAPAYS